MVSIIKRLADDPLQKPEPLHFDEFDLVIDKSNPNAMKTVERKKPFLELVIFYKCHLDNSELLSYVRMCPLVMVALKL